MMADGSATAFKLWGASYEMALRICNKRDVLVIDNAAYVAQ
jgi:hypothetical protein